MSHFSKLRVQVKDAHVAHKVAEKMGWTIKMEDKHVNGWSRETITNCSVYRDGQGKVKMVVDANGDVIHDAFYMGREANQFLCEYSEDFIRSMASREGAMVRDMGIDNQGNRVLEVAYLY